jgi:hypothetical protein
LAHAPAPQAPAQAVVQVPVQPAPAPAQAVIAAIRRNLQHSIVLTDLGVLITDY